MTTPLVSVVVPSYRGADRLPGLFDSFRAQDFAEPWELIVVLDGVVDDSVAVVESADGDLPIQLVRFPENRGRPAALNAGFARARGDILIRCDDDLGLHDDFLTSHARAHSGAGAVGAIGLCHDVLPDSGYARVYGRVANERFRADAYALSPERHWKFWAANCSVTRDVFDRVGGYDEAFREYGWEDVDWGYRLHEAGVPAILDRTLEVEHRGASATVAARVRRSYLGGRAHARFDAKHRIAPELSKPVGVPQVLWSFAVRSGARLGGLNGFEGAGRRLDRRIETIPARVATKTVAYLVESAAIAGYRSFGGA